MNDPTVEQTHLGGVSDRQSESGRVQEPVTGTIEHRDDRLVLREAGRSEGGLNDTLSQGHQVDSAAMLDGSGFNTVAFVDPGAGMSIAHSKLA